MTTAFRAVVAALVALASVAWARDAGACAACGCGDPTLTAMGSEKPFGGRLRAALDFRYREDSVGEKGVDQIRIDERRVDAQVAWAPVSRVFLLLTVPTLHRNVRYVNERRETTFSLGDVELRSKFFVYEDRAFAPRHLIAFTVGAKLPTAPRRRDATGTLVPVEVQPGTGSLDPLVGFSYAWFKKPWSLYVSLQGTMPGIGPSDHRAPPSLRSTVALQYQFVQAFALRGGVDGRFDGKARENGAVDRDSGGAVGYGTLEALVTPVEDLVVIGSARVPVVQALQGFHHEGPVFGVAVAYDF